MNQSKMSRKKTSRTKQGSRSRSTPIGKPPRRPGSGKSIRDSQPNLLEMVEASLHAVNKVKDAKTTIREFNHLMYPAPKEYSPSEIVRLREGKLGMSQAAFALACNAKLSTLQKWEAGVNRPTPPVNRLFQIIERGGLAFLTGS